MINVPEGTHLVVTAAFKNENTVLVVPNSITYRIDDETSGRAIVAVTTVSPASSVNIQVASAQNRILNAANSQETRVMTVVFTYENGTKTGTDEYKWKVMRVKGVEPLAASTSPSASLSPSASPSAG